MTPIAAVARPATVSALERIEWAMSGLAIELPSWGFVNTGTRFGVFPQAGVPRDAFEKIDDAATVNRYTGIAGSVALHIPWDRVEDWPAFKAYAAERGLRIGGINSNTFQDQDYKLGSLCHPEASVRAKAIKAIVECCEIAAATDSKVVKVWLADGTNYPGQDDMRWRRHRLVEALREIYPHLPSGVRMFLEYKLYEPALYSTDVQDWGQSLSVCRAVGEMATVCVDTGHHAMGVNIEQIVAALLAEGRLGGFDLNDKKYGDDDLMVGSHRSLPALPHRPRARQRHARRRGPGRPALRQRDRLHARPVPQHRAQDPGHDPLGHEPPGGSRQGAPGRPRGAARRPGRRRRPRGEPAPRRRLRDRRAAAPRRAARPRGLPADPYRAYLQSGEAEARAAARVGGSAAGWG